jgi:hypothetical protein
MAWRRRMDRLGTKKKEKWKSDMEGQNEKEKKIRKVLDPPCFIYFIIYPKPG